ncbi:MAG: nucleoside hydrolase [Pelagibacteraceae bacterium]|nr:nucleoside hydrolase [Pelagibacteraceae bacterium]PPR51119.1 MAG: Pyrimidine-specific ribonucleoside hydrolase RihB [Alphaproteobacteria bacterium MarineAlpha5_Bin10]
MKKIILDCDPGHDDAVAIMFAAASSEIDLLGITCVAGNTTLNNATLNALKICSFINKTNINIYAGCNSPIKRKLVTADHVHGKSGLDYEGEDINIQKGYKIQKEHAVDFIIEQCKKSKEKIYLCPTGPLTNIARALTKYPQIANNIEKIIFMGGAAKTIGNITPSAEFNIFVDPTAANIVLKSKIPIVMMGLDVTHKVLVDENVIKDFLSIGNKTSYFFKDLMNFYSKFHKEKYNTNSSPLHDPCVIGYLLNNDLFDLKFLNVIVEEESELTMGKTIVDWLKVTNREANCYVADNVNVKEFFSLLKEKISLLP